MIHVKAYKLDAATSTRIEGGVTAASIPLLDVVGMSPIKKSLERDATQFEMSEVSLDIHGLPEDHFADHMKDGSGNKADRPYVFEIQYGSAWDAADSRVVFYGVLDPGSVQYDPKTEITSVSVLSWDKLLKDHPGLEARPTIKSSVWYGPRALKGDKRSSMVLLAPDESIDLYLQAGSTIKVPGKLGDYNVDFRLLVNHVEEYDIPLWGEDRTFRRVYFSSTTGSGLEKGPYYEWYTHVNSGGRYAPARNVIYIDRDAYAGPPEAIVGCTVQFPSAKLEYTIEAAREMGGTRPGFHPRKRELRLSLDRSLDLSKITPGVTPFFILEPIIIEGGAEVEIYGPVAYDYDPPEGRAPAPWDDPRPNRFDFSAEHLVAGIAKKIVPLNALVTENPLVNGTLAKISRFFNLDENPATALSDIQRAAECFIEFEPHQGDSGRINGGARKVRILMYTRAHVMSQPTVALPVPVNFKGQVLGDRKELVIVEAPAINEPAFKQKAYGWYPEIVTSISSGDRRNAIVIDGKLIAPAGDGAFMYEAGTPTVNDTILSGIARRYWNFYGANYWRKQSVELSGIYDFIAMPGFGPYETYLGRKISGTVEGAEKTGIVTELSVDYDKETTSLTVIVGDDYAVPANIAPVARLSVPEMIYGDSNLQGTVIADASGSYDPNGDPISFRWYKNGVQVAGQYSQVAEIPIVNGDTIEVRVIDPDGAISTASAQVAVVPLPAQLEDASAVPSLLATLNSGNSTDEQQAITVRADKPGAELEIQYIEFVNGQTVDGETNDGIKTAAVGVGSINEVLMIDRPLVSASRPDPVKTVNIRVVDLSNGIASSWQTIPVEKSAKAQAVTGRALIQSGSRIDVSYECDSDTVTVNLELYEEYIGATSLVTNLLAQTVGLPNEGSHSFTGLALISGRTYFVRIVPFDADGQQGVPVNVVAVTGYGSGGLQNGDSPTFLDLTVMGTLSVAGAATFEDSITATGPVVFSGAFSASGPFDVSGPAKFTNTAEFTEAVSILPLDGPESKVFQFNAGYALYVDSVGAGPANNRLWLEAPDGGEVVVGPRSGNSELGQFRVRARTMRLETANYQNGEVSGYGSIFVDGGTLGTDGYVSRLVGAQINFTTGHADFRSLYADEIQTQAFTADVAQLLVGSEIISKSRATLAESFTVPAVGSTATLVVEDLEELGAMPVFENGDTIRLRYISREGGGLIVADAWGTVASYVNSGNGTQSWTWTTRKLGPGVQGKVIHRGAVAYDYGTPGSGMIYSTVLDAAGSPYTQYQTWSDTDGDFAPDAYAVLARLGNLNGIGKTVAGRTVGGNGLYSTNVFLEGVIAVSRGYFGANGHAIVGDNLSGETQTGKVLVGNYNSGTLPIVKLAGHNTTSFVQMYYTSSSDWGLKGVINGNEYFKLSTTSHIGGIKFDNTAMWSGTKGSARFQLNADGSGRLANGNISWNASGTVTFGSGVSLSWSQVSGRPTNLAGLDSAAASKLNGIEAGAQKNPSYITSTYINRARIESPTINAGTINSAVLNSVTGNFTGTVTATTLNATQSGNLAGWTIGSGLLQKIISPYVIQINAPTATSSLVFLITNSQLGVHRWYVRADGFMYATNVQIYGTFSAFEGKLTMDVNGLIYRGGNTYYTHTPLRLMTNAYLEFDSISSPMPGNAPNGRARIWVQTLPDGNEQLLVSINGVTKVLAQ